MTITRYVTKFMLEVRREDMAAVIDKLGTSVLTEMIERGYSELLCLFTEETLNRINPEKARKSLAEVSKRLVREQRVRAEERGEEPDSGLESDLSTLRMGMIEGVWSSAHGMVHHHKKNKRPDEYLSLENELRLERNRDIADGVQIDLYLSSLGELPDYIPILEIIEKSLGEMLFSTVCAIEYDILGEATMLHQRFALRTFFETERVRSIDADYTAERVRETIESVGDLGGASGALALRSTKHGYVRAVGWRPGGIGSHRSYHPKNNRRRRDYARAEDVYELMTFWNSEAERDAARDFMEKELLRVPVRQEFDRSIEITDLTGEGQ